MYAIFIYCELYIHNIKIIYYMKNLILSRRCLLIFSLIFLFPTTLVLGRSHSSDTLRLCSNNVFPPYEFFNEDGQPDGFDIDVLKALMQRIGRPYTMKLYRWDIAQQRFKEGKEDVLMGVFRHEGLLGVYKYGISYASLFHAAIYRRGSHSYNSIRSMRGKKVLLERGDGMELLMRKEGLSKEIVYVDNMVVGLKKLSAGEGDLAIGAMEMANFTIKTQKLDNLDMNGLELLPEEFSFVCHDDRLLAQLDKAMIDIRKDGTYQKLYDKWFVNYGESQTLRIVMLSLLALIVVAAISFIFITILRKRVAAARKEICKRNEELRSYAEKLNYTLESCGIKVWKYDINTGMFSIYSKINSEIESIPFKEFFDRIESDDPDSITKMYEDISAGRLGAFSQQLQLKKYINDVNCHYVIYNGIPEYDANNKIISYFGLSRDVTEFITIQNKLEYEKIKAQSADKLKTAFLANMSHEIRTPLNSIVGFSQLLQDTEDKDQKRFFIKIINENTDNLLRLINDILELSKIESGVVDIVNSEFDMSENFNALTSALRDRSTNDSVEFIVDNPYSSCIINCDSNRIAELITNFTTNAIKHTHHGHIKVGYECLGNHLKVYVEDTGSGIPQKDTQRIFERFVKLDDFVQGTGLGLSICKAIIDTYKGTIGVDSELGVGSTFWAVIPCRVLSIS